MAYLDKYKKYANPWRAAYNHKTRKIHLGYYPTWKDARIAELKEQIRYLQEELEDVSASR